MLIINLNQDFSSKNKYISNTLLSEIERTLQENKKIIIYINKKGEYSSLICQDCKKIFKCKNCDVSQIIHSDKMVCHICGFTENIYEKCDNCGKKNLIKIGVGTEQIENFLKNEFKDKKIFRFDTSSVKNKSEKENSLNSIKEANIIIGTKMITTGFDFSGIGLIAVILIEQELQFARYNSEERLFTNIKQLIGRGSRKGENTKVLIQSFIPENPSIKMIIEDNYKEFFKKSLLERKLFNYPPFLEYAILEYRSEKKEKALNYTKKIKEKLDIFNKNNEIEIIFQENAFKKFNKYHYKIILKGDNLKIFLENIKKEIFTESNLSLSFE